MVFAAEEYQNEADQIPKPGKKAAVKKKILLREKSETSQRKRKIMDKAYGEWPPFKCKVVAALI